MTTEPTARRQVPGWLFVVIPMRSAALLVGGVSIAVRSSGDDEGAEDISGPAAELPACAVALGAIVFVTITGATVRLTGSGLGCDNWPRCGDTFLPPKSFNSLVEFSNRGVGIAVGIATVIAALAALRVRNLPRWLLWGTIALPLSVAAQGVLGGITVLTELHPLIVMGHFLLSVAAIALAVVVAIIWIMPKLRSVGWAIGLALVLAGALGNLVDRFLREPGPLRGHVVDFLSPFAPNGDAFPVFNIADSSIVCGGALIVLMALLGRDYDGRSTRDRKQ